MLLFLLSLTRHCWCFLKKFDLFIFGRTESSLLCTVLIAVVSPGYSLVVVHGLLIVVASGVAEHGL